MRTEGMSRLRQFVIFSRCASTISSRLIHEGTFDMLNIADLRAVSLRVGRLVAIVAVASLLGACGQESAEPALPEASVNEDVAVVVNIDADAISPANLRASAMALLNAVPKESAQERQMAEEQLNQRIEEYAPVYENLVKQGVRAISIALAPVESGQAEGMMLLRTEGDVDLAALRDRISALYAQAGADNMPEDATFEKHGENWAFLQTGEEETRSPADGSAEATQAFENAMARVPGGIKLALRMTNVVDQQAQKMQNASGPMAMFAQPLQSLDFAVMGVTTGDSPAMTAQMQFSNADAATTFLDAWNGMMSMAKAATGAQLQNAENPPARQTLDAIFASLQMRQDDATLSMTLGTEFVENIAKVAPAASPMIMGGMGGGGAMPPAPGNRNGNGINRMDP